MAFQSYIDPIVTLVDRYFEKRRTLSGNKPESGAEQLEAGSSDYQEALPESPCKLLRDEKGRVFKCIYGDYEELTESIDTTLTIWQEVIIRNEEGKTTAIETTYPDGSASTEMLVRENGKVTGVK